MNTPLLHKNAEAQDERWLSKFGHATTSNRFYTSIIYYGIILQIYLAPLPLASNRTFFWLFWGVLNGALLTLWSYAFITKKIQANISIRQIWFFFAIFLILMAWPLAQISLTREAPHALWYFLSATLNSEPLLQKISVSTFDTILGIVRYACYAALFWVTIQICGARRRYSQKFLRHIFYSALAYAVYSVIAFAVSSDSFFLYPNSRYNPYISGTYVNRNHYATHAGFAIIIGFGLMFQALRAAILDKGSSMLVKSERLKIIISKISLYIAAIAILLASLLLTFSRAGLISTSIGIIIFLVLLMFTRFFKTFRWYLVFINVGLIVLFIAAINTGGHKTIERALTAKSDFVNRQYMYDQTKLAIGSEYRTQGSGLGTFEDAYQGYITPHSMHEGVIDHAHNTYLENFLELGVPAYSAVLVLTFYFICYALYVLLTKNNKQIYAITLLAFFTQIGVHALFDFSIEMPALVITTCIATAAITKEFILRKKTGRT